MRLGVLRLISHNESTDIQKMFRNFISEDLKHNLRKPPKINCRQGLESLVIDYIAYGDGDHLYLKFGNIYGDGIKRIQIAVIVFKKTKSNFGTLLLSKLADIAEKYDYSMIEIHSPNEASTAFGEKFGFKKDGNCLLASISNLRSHLLERDKK